MELELNLNADEKDPPEYPPVVIRHKEMEATQTLPVIKLITKAKIRGSKSRTKLHLPYKVKPALGRSHSRRDCKACDDIQILNIKAQPAKFTHDFERLQYFVKLYM